MHFLKKLIGVLWTSRTPNTDKLSRRGLLTMLSMILQRRLHCLGHVRRMKDGKIAKDVLYGELIAGKRNFRRP